MNRNRRATNGHRTKRAEIGIFIGNHELCVADGEFRMADFPARLAQAVQLARAKNLRIEVDGSLGIANDEIGRECRISAFHKTAAFARLVFKLRYVSLRK